MLKSYAPSQADVTCFKAFKSKPDGKTIAKYPHVFRWYKHIASFESDFATLPGDASKVYTAYGPEAAPLPVNPAKAPAEEEEEEDVDLFGDDDEEEDAEAARIREERLAEYNKKKALKTKPAAKSVVTMDVKPWDDETDMAELEKNVRAIEKDGLLWGASKLVAIGFGIKKLQITLVVEDEKVSLDELQEQIQEDEDHVQSTDIVSLDHVVNGQRIWAQKTIADDYCFLGCHAETLIDPRHPLERSAEFFAGDPAEYREEIRKHDFYPVYDYDEDEGVVVEWNLLKHLQWQMDIVQAEFDLGI